jgi:hypothetical protein
VEISSLKSQICNAAREGQAIRSQIQATRAQERDALWNQKRAVGRRTRYLLLAYGYRRGVPYRRIETRCREGNDPQWYVLADALMALEPRPADATAWADYYQHRQAFRAPLEAWLQGAVAAHEAVTMGARS